MCDRVRRDFDKTRFICRRMDIFDVGYPKLMRPLSKTARRNSGSRMSAQGKPQVRNNPGSVHFSKNLRNIFHESEL